MERGAAGPAVRLLHGPAVLRGWCRRCSSRGLSNRVLGPPRETLPLADEPTHLRYELLGTAEESLAHVSYSGSRARVTIGAGSLGLLGLPAPIACDGMVASALEVGVETIARARSWRERGAGPLGGSYPDRRQAIGGLRRHGGFDQYAPVRGLRLYDQLATARTTTNGVPNPPGRRRPPIATETGGWL
jgi:hypothetical protein